MSDYRAAIVSGEPMLTEAAVGTRIRLQTPVPLDPVLDLSGLGESGDSAVLRAVAGEYRAIAAAFDLRIEIGSVTYWASPDHLAAAGRPQDLDRVNAGCVRVLDPLRDERTFVSGVVGPRADGYRPREVMGAAQAEEYHTPQVTALAGAGPDLLLASTMSARDEAVGLAQAMADSGLPYVVAFVAHADACLPDGTLLPDVVEAIDALPRPPVHYLMSCTHPAAAAAALARLAADGHDLTDRLIGIKANGSSASAAEREATDRVLADDPLPWARQMVQLREEYGLRVLGGCCGTDSRHLLALACALD